MTRRHDTENPAGDFNVGINDDGTWPTAAAQIAILADIRRELRKLNQLLACPNTLGIPRTLKSIDRRMAKHMPLRKARA